ncbi:unnamed protein product, partial [Didymodactylos carnosus]
MVNVTRAQRVEIIQYTADQIHRHILYFRCYLFIKLLYLINIVSQLILLHVLVGVRLFRFDSLMKNFSPKIYCLIQIQSTGFIVDGTHPIFTVHAECLLHLDMYLGIIYLMFGYRLVFIGICTIYRICGALISSITLKRLHNIRKHLLLSNTNREDVTRFVERFESEYCRRDGYLIFLFIRAQVGTTLIGKFLFIHVVLLVISHRIVSQIQSLPMSRLIIRTYLNSLTKSFDDLPHLTNDQYMKLIEKLSHQIDNFSNELSMDSSSSSEDVAVSRDQSKQMVKMILEQHDLMVKTLCSQHVRVSPVNVSSPQSGLPQQVSSQTSSLVDSHIGSSHTDNTLSSTPVQQREITTSPLKKAKQFELVTTAGSSITRGLGNGTIDFSNKSFRYHVYTKNGAGIERMTEFLKEKHFKPSPHFIVCVGTTNLKYDKPSDALDKTELLIATFKNSYPNSKLALTTLSPMNICGLKASVEALNEDIREYNGNLASLTISMGVDLIPIDYDERDMISSLERF